MELDIEYIARAEDGSEKRECFVKFSLNSFFCENVKKYSFNNTSDLMNFQKKRDFISILFFLH